MLVYADVDSVYRRIYYTGVEPKKSTKRGEPMSFKLTVYGTPAPAGSKKVVPMGGRYGVVDASKRSAPWKKEIRQTAGRMREGSEPMDGPLEARFVFYVQRPKGHYGTGRNEGVVKESAPEFPAVKPDVLKLARAVEDALSGIVYRDDCQIVIEQLEKRYGSPERVEIAINPVER
jgi:Holliday junction resolvase RusA-like endonuclease